MTDEILKTIDQLRQLTEKEGLSMVLCLPDYHVDREKCTFPVWVEARENRGLGVSRDDVFADTISAISMYYTETKLQPKEEA